MNLTIHCNVQESKKFGFSCNAKHYTRCKKASRIKRCYCLIKVRLGLH